MLGELSKGYGPFLTELCPFKILITFIRKKAGAIGQMNMWLIILTITYSFDHFCTGNS